MLTSFNGHTIAYDGIGNPTTYYNGSAYTFTWTGRQLTGAVRGSKAMSFTYNDDGIRTSKTVDGVTHTYQLNGSQIVSEQWGDKLLVYLYDASGAPIGMMYRTTSYDINSFDVFWFEKNLQGDIVAVYNSAGSKVAYYTYTDAWGNHSVGYINLSTNEGVQYNPFRYRGYYYDTDLGMYYLQSRYYDPNTCRFINADVYISTGYGIIGNNMFAYCNNIPTCYSDPEGTVFTYTCDYGEGYTLNGWPLEGAGQGGDGGGGSYFGLGTAYHNYAVYSKNATLDAGLGGYYYSGGGSIGGYTAQFAVGKVTVTDSMATTNNTQYITPKGGGGITSTINIKGTKVTFGHGGRHLSSTNLSISDVEGAIAKDVITKSPTNGIVKHGFVNVNGIEIFYNYFTRDTNVINVGSYRPLK